MATAAAATVAGVASLAGSTAGALFSYNKAAFVLDQTLRQWAVHQIDLYREDLRDLFGLTISRMDTYLTVNSVALAVSVHSIYCGMIPPDIPQPKEVPSWLWFIWILNLAASTVLLLLSVCFALHASIVAQSLEVKLLTRWLRLPLPKTSDIANAADTIEVSEGEDSPVAVLLMRRFAFAAGEGEAPRPLAALVAGSSRKDARDVGKNGMMDHAEDDKYTVSHFSLFQRLQKSWQGYDAYARVFMVLANNQMLLTFADFALGSTMMGDREVWAAWAFVVVIATAAMLHLRMNLTFESYNELIVILTLAYLTPLSAAAAATLDYAGQTSIGEDTALASIALHCLWYYYLVLQGLEATEVLPGKFNIVRMTSDILLHENPFHGFVRHEMTEGGIDGSRRPSDYEWDFERNDDYCPPECRREVERLDDDLVEKEDKEICSPLHPTDQDSFSSTGKKSPGNKKDSQLALMEEGRGASIRHSKIGEWVEAHYGQRPAPEDRWQESCFKGVTDPSIVREQVDEFGENVEEFEKEQKAGKGKSCRCVDSPKVILKPCEYRHPDRPKNITHYRLRPWSIYKQVSAIISAVWTVGLIWWALVCADVPTGTDLPGPVFKASSAGESSAGFPPFFTPIGLDFFSNGSAVATDGISFWPRLPCSVLSPSDVLSIGEDVMVANGTDRLLNCATAESWKLPVAVSKVAYIREGSLAVSTPDNCLYLLEVDDDGEWRRKAKIGDYDDRQSSGGDVIGGIAFSRRYGMLVLMTSGNIDIWNMADGRRTITHLTLPEVQRYTAIAAVNTQGQEEEEDSIVVSGLGKDQRADLFRINEEVNKFLEK
ncbi:pumilio domain member 4 [Perkinsus olseni]|uniref:Pumilio domain member 4 n=1 Tax=Perkinsus olseni TaxID=32597 RepID=A0A7J6PS78_PEROL|nr:pumilio domain member 4 [Perkinsus olseni]